MSAASDDGVGLITLRSTEGQRLLLESQTPDGGFCQKGLMSIFKKQLTGHTCGIASTAMVLSASHAFNQLCGETDGKVDEAKLPFSEVTILECNETRRVISNDEIATIGLTLDKLAELLVSHQLHIKKVHAGDSSLVEFRTDLITALSQTDSRSALIVNYSKDVLAQGLPYGHHSPVAAYNRTTDRVLIMDTWKETEECWATVEDLFIAMNTVDTECGLKRGYIVINCLQQRTL